MNQSLNFIGNIGETVAPSAFPKSNYIVDPSKWDYEGDWAFCRFDSEEIFGARFGFGRGTFDTTDYGATEPVSELFFLHIELMTRDGAALWISSGTFQPGDMRTGTDSLDRQLHSPSHEIFRIQGWPRVHWHMESDDREIEVTMHLAAQNVTILPDAVLPHNRFAMWLAICRAEGEVRFQNRRTRVNGTAFYDHPRITLRPHDVPLFGWLLYMPMHFADGSYLASYYTRDIDGSCNRSYSFGLYVDRDGKATWLPRVEMTDIRMDADDKPRSWSLQLNDDDLDVELSARVRDTAILGAWGKPDVAQTRRANANIPLVFDCEASMRSGNTHSQVRGGGLAEYICREGLRWY